MLILRLKTLKLTTGSSPTTTAYSETFSPDDLVIAASIYQNDLVCIAFQTGNGQFRLDAFKITASESFGAETDRSDKLPLIKIGSSLLVDFYPAFLSFADPGEKMEYLVIGHGPIDGHGDLRDLPQKANTRNEKCTLCVYQFDTCHGIVQDGRSEFILPNSQGKIYLCHCRYLE